MKLAASNISWKREDNEVVAEMLRKHGITGVEVTPSTVFDCPWWREQGFEVVAMQGLLYGIEGASLWGEGKKIAVAGLEKAIHLAGAFKIPALVFGCPTARNPSNIEPTFAREQAVRLFQELGDLCGHAKTQLLIEPLGNSFGCWFLTTTMEVAEFVQTVGRTTVGVQFDANSLRSTGENAQETLNKVRDWAGHYHASNIDLRPMPDFGECLQHHEMRNNLRSAGYHRWVSLEQRDRGLKVLDESLALFAKAYA